MIEDGGRQQLIQHIPCDGRVVEGTSFFELTKSTKTDSSLKLMLIAGRVKDMIMVGSV